MKKFVVFALILPWIASAEIVTETPFDPYAYNSPEELPWEIQFNQDFDDNGLDETTGTILLQQFNSNGGNLSFDYTFLTDEVPTDSTEGGYIVHDIFRVTLWELDETSNRTGNFQQLLGGAATSSGTQFDPYSGTFEPIDFNAGGTYPGSWTTNYSLSAGEFTSEFTYDNPKYFSSGAVSGSFTGPLPSTGFWELEFLVAHSEDYLVASALAINNVVGGGILNGDFENGLNNWFYIGDTKIYSNLNGPYDPIINQDTFYDPLSLENPQFNFLPAPGGTFSDTASDSYALISAPDFYFEVIPEPSTYILLLSGGLISAVWFYRRKKNS